MTARLSAPGRAACALLLTTALVAVPARPGVQAQSDSDREYTLQAPSGAGLAFSRGQVTAMLDDTRRLVRILEEDPEVLYYVGTGPPVEPEDPDPAYPWRAVRVLTDSTARVAVPGNYREARRAYYGYAVERMEALRDAPPAADCATTVEREVKAVSAFVDGWIVTRTLYGGPAFPPLDAFAFAREAGHLPAMVVELGDVALGGCVDRWRREHRDALEAYRRWRRETLGDEVGPDGNGSSARGDGGAGPRRDAAGRAAGQGTSAPRP